MDPMQALRELKSLAELAPVPLQAHVHASHCFRTVLLALKPKPEEKPSGDQS